MAGIQSNFDTASQVATTMGHAADSLMSATSKSITTADQTNLTANLQTKNCNQQILSMASNYAQLFNRDVAHVQSVTKEFQRVDEELKAGLAVPLMKDPIKDLNTYVNSKK